MKNTAPVERQFAEYLEACTRYWTACWLSRRRMEMLKSEMAPSIYDAIRRGEKPDEIFGPADEWAESLSSIHGKEDSSLGWWRLRLSGFVFYLLLIGAGVAGVLHLQTRSATFALDFGTVGLVVCLALLVSVSLSPRSNLPRTVLRGEQKLWIRGEYLVLPMGFSIWGFYALAPFFPSAMSVRWSLIYSLGLGVLAVVVGLLHFRWDTTRLKKKDPELRNLELVRLCPQSSQNIQELNRLLRLVSLASLLCFGMAWFLLPVGVKEQTTGALIACAFWTLYLFLSMVREKAQRSGDSDQNQPCNPA